MPTRTQKSVGKKGVTIHAQAANHNLKHGIELDVCCFKNRTGHVKRSYEQYLDTEESIPTENCPICIVMIEISSYNFRNSDNYKGNIMVSKVELDEYDRKILRALQENADFSMADLGNLIGLSHTPCWRRLKRLETEGVIRGKVTLLDAKKIDLGVRVHAFVTAKNHDEEALSAFEAAVQSIPEIVECYSTSGDKDYVLQIVINSVEEYEQLLRKTLLKLPNVGSIHSTFSLKQIKYTTQLPI